MNKILFVYSQEKLAEKRQGIVRPFAMESNYMDDGRHGVIQGRHDVMQSRHDVMRRRLLEALQRRIEARNLLMHEKALLRERMLKNNFCCKISRKSERIFLIDYIWGETLL